MKRFFKGLGRGFVLLLIAAVLYYASATIYYRITGDSSHSGMLGVKSVFIYAIVMMTEGYIRRAKRLKETGTLFGCDAGSGVINGLNRLGMIVYTLALVSLFSLMLYLIVPENSPVDDALLYTFLTGGFLFIIFGIMYVISRLVNRKKRKQAERNSAYARRIAVIYGPYDPKDSRYYSDELYQNAFCRFLIGIFGNDCGFYDLFDADNNCLKPDVTAEELIGRLDSDPRLLINYGYIAKSLYALRTEINRLCASLGYDVSISERDTERERGIYDDIYSERRRIDGRAARHDMSIISGLLGEKGYRLVLLTGYFYDNSLYTDELEHYEYAGYSEEDLTDEYEDEVTVREYLTVCPISTLEKLIAVS